MADLISRAAAIKGLLSMCPEKTEPGSFDEYGVTVLCGAVDVVIKALPAVDAVPVVHARWVDEDFPYKDANPRVTAICSKCGNIAHRMEHGYSILSKYCPNCGAKMDGERRESE